MINGQVLKKPRENTAFLFQNLGLFPWQTSIRGYFDAFALKKHERQRKRQHKEGTNFIGKKWGSEKSIIVSKRLKRGSKAKGSDCSNTNWYCDFLLMDEPTSSLDAMTKEQIQQLILAQQQKLKTTLLFVSHDIEEAVFLGEADLHFT